MKAQQVTYSISDGVMTITVDNPSMQNALTYLGMAQLADALEKLNADDSIKVGLLKGSHGYFFNGGRVNTEDPIESNLWSEAVGRYLKVWEANQKPIVSAINGDCFEGPGMGMAANSDLTVALSTARFGLPEIKQGGIPMMIITEIMDSLSRRTCLEACLSGLPFSAEKAYQAGLVNTVVEEKDFDKVVERYVNVLKHADTETLSCVRKLFQR